MIVKNFFEGTKVKAVYVNKNYMLHQFSNYPIVYIQQYDESNLQKEKEENDLL